MLKKISLSAISILKKYGSKNVVDDISLNVKQGEIVGLLGPNGAGKTTSFYIIVGLIKSDSGSVYIGDNNITKLPMYKRARNGIGYLAQEASIFRNLSVEDNILAVLENQGITKKEQLERTENLLKEFSLSHIRKYMGKVLSGGERRRTEIARALATEPKFILLDEPFAGVDPIAVEEIQAIVYRLKKKNIGILITDHNVGETLSITSDFTHHYGDPLLAYYSSINSKFKMIQDPTKKYNKILSIDYNSIFIENNDKESIKLNFIDNKNFIYQYYNFNSKNEIFSVLNNNEEKIYLYDYNLEPFIDFTINSTHPISIIYSSRKKEFKIFKIFNNTLSIIEIED